MSNIVLTQQDADFIISKLRETVKRLKNSFEKTSEITYESVKSQITDELTEKCVKDALEEIKQDYTQKTTDIYKCIELLTVGSESVS